MKHKSLVSLFLAFGMASVGYPAAADDLPQNATFTTLITTPLVVEGLTGDDQGNLYTTGRGGSPCPVWRINIANPSLVVVGNVTAPCSPSGIAFNEAGDLFLSEGNNVLTLTPNSVTPPTAVIYASGVTNTNGLAFDKDGNLWTGDGTSGLGRVWKIPPCAVLPCPPEEVFRIQPMNNSVSFGGVVANPGVGRANTTIPGTAQNLVANGLAFTEKGDLLVADTARGAIWKVEFNADGSLKSQVDCDETFTANTLCLDNIWVTHPYNEGTDGIALDRKGNVWNSANERNAIVVVTNNGQVVEIFRNPVNTNTNLRNSATNPANNNRILEFPSSPFLSGKTFCTANSDGNRRDNSPATSNEAGVNVGEIGGVNQDETVQDKGKISCMDQELKVPGLPLPIN